jgi:hypothetical protein
MHKSIHELRKEVKALKKALAKYEFQTSTATEAKTPPAVQPPATSETDELANPEAQPPITDDSQKPRTTRKPRTS